MLVMAIVTVLMASLLITVFLTVQAALTLLTAATTCASQEKTLPVALLTAQLALLATAVTAHAVALKAIAPALWTAAEEMTFVMAAAALTLSPALMIVEHVLQKPNVLVTLTAIGTLTGLTQGQALLADACILLAE